MIYSRSQFLMHPLIGDVILKISGRHVMSSHPINIYKFVWSGINQVFSCIKRHTLRTFIHLTYEIKIYKSENGTNTDVWWYQKRGQVPRRSKHPLSTVHNPYCYICIIIIAVNLVCSSGKGNNPLSKLVSQKRFSDWFETHQTTFDLHVMEICIGKLGRYNDGKIYGKADCIRDFGNPCHTNLFVMISRKLIEVAARYKHYIQVRMEHSYTCWRWRN
jgi:hypothetical protein